MAKIYDACARSEYECVPAPLLKRCALQVKIFTRGCKVNYLLASLSWQKYLIPADQGIT